MIAEIETIMAAEEAPLTAEERARLVQEIARDVMGLGPIELHALAIGSGGLQERVAAAPVAISIEPPRALPALKDPPASLAAGIALKLANEKIVTVQETRDAAWLELAGVNQNQNFTAQGRGRHA